MAKHPLRVCVTHCIYMWVSHAQNKQVRLVLISVANCTFLLRMPSTVIWVIIYSVSLSRMLSLRTAHTHNTPKNKNTLFTACQLLSLYSLLPPGLSLLPNPEWKGPRGSQMVDVWMPINSCLSPPPTRLPLQFPIGDPLCLYNGTCSPFSTFTSTFLKRETRWKSERWECVCRKGGLQSAQEKEKIKRQAGVWDVHVW